MDAIYANLRVALARALDDLDANSSAIAEVVGAVDYVAARHANLERRINDLEICSQNESGCAPDNAPVRDLFQ